MELQICYLHNFVFHLDRSSFILPWVSYTGGKTIQKLYFQVYSYFSWYVFFADGETISHKDLVAAEG